MAKKNKTGDLVSHRRASHEYEILDTFEAGIVLVGTEVKALRAHEASLAEAYITVDDDELWLVGCSISPYRYGNVHNHEERRPRKLLLHKREIERLRKGIQEKGLTIVPLAFYLKRGRIKVRIALARGKKQYDKRASIKEKEDRRRMQRLIKE